MRKGQGRIELVFILIVIAMLAGVIFLPQISHLTGLASAGQENLVTIEKNIVTAINLSTYLPGVERTYLATSPSNMDVKIKDELLVLTPDKGFTGERLVKVFVADQDIQELVFRIEVVDKKNPILEKIKEEYEQKKEPIYIPPPEPETGPEPEEEPEDVIPGNKLYVSGEQDLHVNLSSYFESAGPYVATGDIDLIVVIEDDLMTIEPYKDFVGQEEITVSSIGDDLEEHAFIVTVGGGQEKGETEKEQENASAAPVKEPAKEIEEEEKQVLVKEEIKDEGKKLGEKIEDEPEFEVYFTRTEQNNKTLDLVFYHDSNKSEKVFVDGNVSYDLSSNVSEPFENITLVVELDDCIVPEFELHVGDDSERFKFGKKIPKVFLKGKKIKKFRKKMLDNLKKKFGKKFRKWLRNETGYEVIDRDDDLVNIRITKHNATVYIKGVNASDVRGVFRWVSSTVLTTEVFAADPIDMEEAVITLPRTDDVTAIVNCPDFNLSSESCPDKWVVTDIPFTKTDTHINFTVDHFSGYGGGNIEVINVQSYPTLYGNWTVMFNTTGTADLTITAVQNTSWTDYADSGYDLKFLEVKCGNQTQSYSWTNDSVFIANYSCDSLGYETSKVLTDGKHALEFRFGSDVDYAFNTALLERENSMVDSSDAYWLGEYVSTFPFIATNAFGDIDGDGYDDMLVGAYEMFNTALTARVGRTYLFYAPPVLSKGNLINSSKGANASFGPVNSGANERSGSYLLSADLNDDAYDDIIIAALTAKKIYVVFGQSTRFNSFDVDLAAIANITWSSGDGESSLAVTDVGDFNGDGVADLIVGGDTSNTCSDGALYGFYGPISPGSYNLHTSANFTLCADQTFTKMNYAHNVGDINNDTYDDIIFQDDANLDLWLFYGGNYLSGTIDADANYNATWSWGLFNHAFEAGDVNGDGIDDFVMVYYGKNFNASLTNVGVAYLVYGADGVPFSGNINTKKVNATFWGGPYSNFYMGREQGYYAETCAAGDINNDGYSDIIMGSYFKGDTCVFLGSSTMESSTNYTCSMESTATGDNLADIVFTGQLFSGNRGGLVPGGGNLGDVNNDSRADLMINAPTFSVNSTSYGAVYLFSEFNAAPTQDNPVLNSTSGSNLTGDNLTVYPVNLSDPNSDSVVNITNWFKNGRSLDIFYMPFEAILEYHAPVSDEVGAWYFDRDFKDATGNGWDGACSSCPLSVGDGQVYSAYDYDGSSDFVYVNDPGASALDMSSWTISSWVNVDTAQTGYGHVISKRDDAAGGANYALRTSNVGNSWDCYFYDTVLGWQGAWNAGSVTKGEWMHVACSYTASTGKMRVYNNGLLVSEQNLGTNPSISNQQLQFGGAANPTNERLDGAIDEVHLFNRVLSPTEILEMYERNSDQSFAAKDYSPNRLSGAVSGAVWTSSGILGSAYDFDGVNDYIRIPDNPVLDGMSEMSIEFWFKANTLDDWAKPVSKFNWVGSANGAYQLQITNTDAFNFDVYNDTGGSYSVVTTSAISSGQWYHAVGVVNGTNVLLYLNGELNNSIAFKGNSVYASDLDLTIGCGFQLGNPDYFFNGTVDEVRIYDTALSPEQVKAHYNSGSPRYDTIVSQETEKGEIWSAELTPDDNVQEGDAKMSNSLQVGSAPTQDAPVLNSTSGSNLTSENITVYPNNLQDADSDAVYNITTWFLNGTSISILNMPFEGLLGMHSVPDSDTVLALYFEENFKDFSGLGNDGSCTNCPALTGGIVGQAYDFDGVNDFVQISDADSLEISNQVTISYWVKGLFDYSASEGAVLEKGGWSSGEYGMTYFQSNKPRFQIQEGNPNQQVDAITDTNDGNWHYVVGTWNGSLMSIYVDGILENTASNTNGFTPDSEDLYIGSRTGSSNYFNGTIDEVHIYNRSLTADEIRYEYKRGLDQANYTVDYSPYHNDGVITDAVWTSSGYIGGAYYFDGIDSYVNAGNDSSLNPSTGNITITLWANLAADPDCDGNANWRMMVRKSDATSAITSGYNVLLEGDRRVTFSVGDGANRDRYISSYKVPIGKWQFLAFEYDTGKGDVRIFFNDTEDTGGSYITNGTSSPIDPNNTDPLYISHPNGNACPANDGSFNGTIDQVQIFNRGLTPEQIAAIYKNHTDTIVSQETSVNDTWFAELTPNDGILDGLTKQSNNITLTDVGCGATLIKNTTLTSNLTTAGDCLVIGADDVTLDCAGYSITGGGSGFGVKASGRNNVGVKNCNFASFKNDIIYDSTTNSRINNTDVIINITNANNTNVTNSNITALYVTNSNNTEIINCTTANYTLSNALIFTVEDLTYGKVKFLQSITESGTSMDSDINITLNKTFVDSANEPGLNVSAEITLKSLLFASTPNVYADRNDDGVYEEKCVAPVCSVLNYAGGVLLFNSTHFTSYASNTNLPPTQDTPILNSTSGYNGTNEDLTVYPQNVQDADNQSVKNITNWYMNSTSIMVLNMPFEGGSNSTFTKDYSGHNNDGTVVNASWDNSAGYDGWGAYNFSGNAYINAGTGAVLNLDRDMSIAVWVKLNSLTGGRQTLVKKSNATFFPAKTPYDFYVNNDDLAFAYTGLNLGGGSVTATNQFTNTSKWYFVVVTRSVVGNKIAANSTMKLYVDGQLVANNTGTELAQDSNTYAGIGGYPPDGPYYLNGSLDEVQIYNRTLSAQQVNSIYSAGLGNYNTIKSQETEVGDVWQACLTPNDRIDDGATKCSNNLTVLPRTYLTCPVVNGTWVVTADYNQTQDIECKIINVTAGNNIYVKSAAAGNVSLQIKAENITIEATAAISADGLGYPGGNPSHKDGFGPGGGDGSNYQGAGGAHAGDGGDANTGVYLGGDRYGNSTFTPVTIGSGGGGTQQSAYHGGAGGGAMRIIVSNTLTVNGAVSSDGNNGLGTDFGSRWVAGGGGGGSVWIQAGALAGTGSISAAGGNGFQSNFRQTGGGGGGRIAVHYNSTSWTFANILSRTDVSGGLGAPYIYSEDGDAGHIVFIDTDDNNLFSTAGMAWLQPDLDANSGWFNWANMTYLDIVSWTNMSYLNINCTNFNLTNTTFLINNVTEITVGNNVLIDSDSVINGTGSGYPAESGPGAGAGGNAGGSGAGHGGVGGEADPISPVPGGVYGSSFQPVTVGSGGGRDSSQPFTAGPGGSALKLFCGNTFVLNGTISVNGVPGATYLSDGGGGGSGGSIWIVVDTLAGNGSFSAVGGAGGAGGGGIDGGGGGGGGRIAVHYNSTSWAVADFLRSTVLGGTASDGGYPGKPGTLAFIDQTNNDFFSTDGFRWQQNDYTTNSAWFSWNDLKIYQADNVVGNKTVVNITVSNEFNVTDSVWNNYQNSLFVNTLNSIIDNSTIANDPAGGSNYLAFNAASIIARTGSEIQGNTNITVDNLTIDASSLINATGSGYAEESGPGAGANGAGGGGGAGHGGAGGVSESAAAAGNWYGSSFQPATFGSGGGRDSSIAGTGGAGGGLVKLVISDVFNFSGQMLSTGAAGSTYSGDGGGGGAGGSIWIVVDTLAGGNGSFSAVGGAGGPGGAGIDGGGAGGGGRIAVYYNGTSWTASDFVRSSVQGGTATDGGQDGKVGTLAFIDQTNTDLFSTDGFKWQQNDYNTNSAWFSWNGLTTYNASDIFSNMTNLKLNVSFKFNSTDSLWNVSVTNHTNIDPNNIYFVNTTYLCGNFTTFSAVNISVDSDSVINGTGSGYPAESGPGAGAGGNAGGSGAGHGGVGGEADPISPAPGGIYGSSFQPVTMGSGGGRDSSQPFTAGPGGSVVKINATNIFDLSGIVTVDGDPGSTYVSDGGGGGSGGSIWAVAGNLTGIGSFSAAGGAGGAGGGGIDGGGGAGGGRIAVYYASTAWNETDFTRSCVSGGAAADGGYPGEVGTLAFIDTTNNNVLIYDGFQFQSNDLGFLNRNLFNITDALARYNNSVAVNATTAINVINSTVKDNSPVTASMITGALSFDSDSTINISGRLDLKYNTFSDTGATYINGLGLTLERTSKAEVSWISALNNIFNLSTHVQLGNIFAYVNSSAVAGLNQSANITFFGVGFIDPVPTVDFEDDGSFVTCPGGVCAEISHVGTTYKFNTTHFSNFSLGDNYTYPNQTAPVLNSSNGKNTTDENLLVYPQNITGEPNATLTNITDWFVNNKSLMVLKMPFDKNSSITAKDYSPFQNNGSVSGPVWTTAGISGGAYLFNGSGRYINVSNDSSLNPSGAVSITAWVKPVGPTGAAAQEVVRKMCGSVGGYALRLNATGTGTEAFIRNSTGNLLYASSAGTTHPLTYNNWYHIAMTYDPAGNLTVYVNGTVDQQLAAIGNLGIDQGSLGIGGYPSLCPNSGWSEFFNGTIDEVRIYNRSLSAQQIAAEFNSGSPDYNTIVSNETNVGDVWRACVVIVDGLVDSAELCSNNMTVLIGPAPPTQDNPIINSTFGTNGTDEDLTVYPQNVSDPNNDPVTNITNWEVDNKSITVLNFPFNTNTTSNATGAVRDYTPYQNNGTLGNGITANVPAWISGGVSGGAYDFDGVSDRIRVSDDSTLNMSGNFSVEFWIKPRAPWSRPVIGKGVSGGINGGCNYCFETTATHKVQFLITDPFGASSGSITSVSNLSTSSWTHVVGTFDNSTQNMSVYINGSLDNSVIKNAGSPPTAGSNDLTIARTHLGPAIATQFFNGSLDEIRVYNRTLSPGQIAENYNAGAPDYRVIDSQETVVNDVWRACLTPNDALFDGPTKCSNNLTIVQYPDCPGDNINGIWIIQQDTSINSNVTCKVINITNSSTLYVNSSGGGNVSIGITAENITVFVNSEINSDGLGYLGGKAAGANGFGPGAGTGGGNGGSGAGHGGLGGYYFSPAVGPRGNWYDSAFNSKLPGSGGGAAGSYDGGDGGGAMKLVASDTFSNFGTISTVGTNGQGTAAGTDYAAGGGSGGSIWIVADNLTGAGALVAAGGDGYQTPTRDGGGGAGGRIVIEYNTTTLTIANFLNANVSGGTTDLASANTEPGYPGSAVFIDLLNNNVLIKSGVAWQQQEYVLHPEFFNWSNFTAVNITSVFANLSGNWQLNVSDTTNISRGNWNNSLTNLTWSSGDLFFENFTISHAKNNASGYMVFNTVNAFLRTDSRILGNTNFTSGNLTIDASSVINATAFGYLGGSASANGFGPGAGSGGGNGGSGAGHGGLGGYYFSPAVGPRGKVYGSSFQTVQAGSGGGAAGSYDGGDGGGTVKIIVSDLFVFNGSIITRGTDGKGVDAGTDYVAGGGSGGSVWIVADNLTGAGALVAAGGDGFQASSRDGGGGAGGRIIVYYNSTSWNSTDFSRSNISGGTTDLANPNAEPGYRGTLAFIDMINDDVNIFKGFRFQANDESQGYLNRHLFNMTDAVVIYNNSVVVNASSAINVINSTVEDNGSQTVSMITGALSFDSNSVINISGVLDLAYSTFSDIGATYIDGLGLILERINLSEIAWHNTSLNNIANLSVNVKPGNISAFSNSSALSSLNQSANITFFGVTQASPVIVWDPEDDGTFVNCPAGVCTQVNYTGTTFLFNVTRFTNYSLQGGGVSVKTTVPDINVLNFRLDNQIFNASFETVNASCPNCSYDLEGVCQLEQEVISGAGTFNMSLFLNGTAVNMQNIELVCTMYDYAVNNLNGANCSGSADNSSACANFVGGGNLFRINLSNSSNFNTSILLGNITPVANCSTVVCYLNGSWVPGDDQEFNITKQFTVTDGTNNATNPNGTLRFTTDKYAGIETKNPDINILNFRLDFQSFNGSFSTGAGLCSGCTFDLSNGTCQVEVEKVFGMFQSYNMSITLTTASAVNMTSLNMVCRDANTTTQAYPACSNSFNPYGTGQPGCVSWTATAGRSTVLAGNAGLSIDLTNFTNITIPLGVISPTQNCKLIACEINGTWQSGQTQEFIMNKTITARAI